ncbi:MAG: TniQ family protein [Gammaproteobacteria bacterium]|uniref:TniQ family protein n=1 Tax=Stutzerimonas stutzeri TaxID=316 RepID=UPI001303C4BE|nr:TniQ family protein [Stutzerimonas stutzeri]MBU1530507.1 TniQ family protein [Gammaproteobacteria bacterium]
MHHKIPFFPSSLPDETLHSRVSRYHFLSGNKTQPLTFRDAFDAAPFPLDVVVPKKITQLAERLPGEAADNLKSLLNTNTLLPLFTSFLGTENSHKKLCQETSTTTLSRIPQRVVGVHGTAKLCIACCESDEHEFGSSYWHRAHQIPGVSSCWKHSETLMSSCQFCSKPFYTKNRLLTMPWLPCECGWSVNANTRSNIAPIVENEYAVFSKELLHGDVPTISQESLAHAYRTRASALGLRAGSLVSQASLFKSIVETLGDEFLCQADTAYAAKKTKTWIRLSTIDNQLDMPITRHLILSFFLFRNFNVFKSALQNQQSLPLVRARRQDSKPSKSEESTSLVYRAKIQQIVNRWPSSTLEDCWKNSLKATSWLFKHDRGWLLSYLSETTQPGRGSNDLSYAKIIEDGIEGLYALSFKPKRVNIGNMLSLLPKKLPGGRDREKLYPEVSKKLQEHYESLWHFHVRRIIWGLHELKRLDLKPTIVNLSDLIKINKISCNSILSHFGWDIEVMVNQKFSQVDEMNKFSITRQWSGPISVDAGYAGRAYQKARMAKLE